MIIHTLQSFIYLVDINFGEIFQITVLSTFEFFFLALTELFPEPTLELSDTKVERVKHVNHSMFLSENFLNMISIATQKSTPQSKCIAMFTSFTLYYMYPSVLLFNFIL